MTVAYEEIIDFIASGTTPSTVISFRPSEEAKKRVTDLIHRQKSSGITPEESAELEQYLHIEHVMRLAKARARKYVDAE